MCAAAQQMKVVCMMCSIKPFLGMFQASWQPAFQSADTLGSRASLSRAPLMQLLQLRLQLLLYHLHLLTNESESVHFFYVCVDICDVFFGKQPGVLG